MSVRGHGWVGAGDAAHHVITSRRFLRCASWPGVRASAPRSAHDARLSDRPRHASMIERAAASAVPAAELPAAAELVEPRPENAEDAEDAEAAEARPGCVAAPNSERSDGDGPARGDAE